MSPAGLRCLETVLTVDSSLIQANDIRIPRSSSALHPHKLACLHALADCLVYPQRFAYSFRVRYRGSVSCYYVVSTRSVSIARRESLTLLGLQSRFGDNWGQFTWNLTAMSPKRGWSSKGAKWTAAAAADKRSSFTTSVLLVRAS